jgi:hypothetical protein
MAYTKYSLTPADNNAAPPNGAPEGMLPSAVNDTMRDMMAQIRDVGDGIRGGTYTMTAPVITGGSITGVALSGNTLTNPVITGGSINNTPIGASTANTGAFTTLSATGNVSFDGGSFVFNETGADKDARFEGDTDANLLFLDASTDRIGIGTSSPSTKLDVRGTAANPISAQNTSATSTTPFANTILRVASNGSNADATINFTDAVSSNGYIGMGGGNLYFAPNSGTEAMRINTSGNVGIGTSSPQRILTVGSGSGSTVMSIFGGTGSSSAIHFTDTNTSTDFQGFVTYAHDVDAMRFGTAETERMRIDSSGNVGIGVTPVTWGSAYKALQIGSTASVYSAAAQVLVDSNSYVDASYLDKYASTAAVSRYQQISGEHRFFNAPSGTAGTTISLTERMRIDSSGRLLVGVTSPVGSTFSTIEYSAATYNGLCLNQSTNTSGGRFMLFASQGTQCGVIDRVGTTSAVIYTAASDQRLKENIVDSPSALNYLGAVKVRSYNWIDGGHQVKYGVIAQEFFEVEPDAVVQGDTGETIEKTWAVDTSALVPAMIKAIQEQQALIENLTTRLNALEGK